MHYVILFLAALLLTIVYSWFRERHALQSSISILQDELYHKTSELTEQIEKTEKSEKYKEFFLANMSHEIRTPMHAISGMTNILRRNEHLPGQVKYLDAIHQSAENLLVILNDILDSSKIEAGKLKIDEIPMEPAKIITDLVEILSLRASDKGLSLTYDIEDGLPRKVIGDPIRLNQILTNLASNAIKFTDQGSVQIICNKVAENGEEMLQFSVKDSGIGIPENKMETIFEVFEQVDGTLSKKFGGTGLGLSICKQLVEMQGGDIFVVSSEGEGSTFTFRLPLFICNDDRLEEQGIDEQKLEEMGRHMTGIKILLAEDNSFNIMLATDDLTHYIPEVSIETATNGKQAVECFEQSVYDLVLMDIQMPEMNGYDATSRIRQLELNRETERHVPIIAMTASLLEHEIDKCYKVGMDNYIPKPYQIEQLIGTIHEEIQKSNE